MGLRLYPLGEPPPRRVMRLAIQADMFLKMLQGMDGKRRVRAEGLPKDVRCVGLTVDSTFNTVDLYLESSDWEEVPVENVVPHLKVIFREFFGDAQPED